MNLRTVLLFMAVASFTFFSMCAAFTFTEPMCRDPHCMRDGGTE